MDGLALNYELKEGNHWQLKKGDEVLFDINSSRTMYIGGIVAQEFNEGCGVPLKNSEGENYDYISRRELRKNVFENKEIDVNECLGGNEQFVLHPAIAYKKSSLAQIENNFPLEKNKKTGITIEAHFLPDKEGGLKKELVNENRAHVEMGEGYLMILEHFEDNLSGTTWVREVPERRISGRIVPKEE